MTTIEPRSSPHPASNPTGLTWLKALPKHWEARKLKHCLGVNESTLPETTEPDLEFRYIEIGAVNSGDLVEPPAIIRFSAAPSRARRIIKGGDTIVSTVRTYLKAVWYAENPGDNLICSTGFAVLTPKQGTVPKFASYVAQSAPFTDQVTAESVGIAYPAITEKKIGDLWIGLPPPEEQTAIVRYLDAADQQIQAYISTKQRLIELLEEQRQAIIHQAVTRGLDPNVQLKPSAVEWLDDVPEHWEVSRVKNEFLSLNHRRVPLSSVERGAMTKRKYDYYGASGVIDKVDSYLFNDQLLLIAEDGANLLLRNLPLAIIARGKFWVNNHAHILKPKRGNLAFLAAIMEGLNYSPWISGAAQPKLTQERLMNISIAVPSKEEQDKVINASMEATSTMIQGIAHARRQVELMQEYRTRLIADVVTGKLDVREAAEALPQLEPVEIAD